ncbi:MAG: CoA pyrophosphatase [Pseudomonadota bacterium]
MKRRLRDLSAERVAASLAKAPWPDDPTAVALPRASRWPRSWAAGVEGGLIPAAVLLPLLERRRGLSVLLTRRSSALKHHGGQVSFPGGRMETDDNDILHTALRETEEEIGIPMAQVDVAGPLSTMPTITGYAVTPFVGFVPADVRLTLDPVEVESAFEVPLAFLLDVDNETRTERVIEGVPVPLVEFNYAGERIWGATASMIVELRKIVLKQ